MLLGHKNTENGGRGEPSKKICKGDAEASEHKKKVSPHATSGAQGETTKEGLAETGYHFVAGTTPVTLPKTKRAGECFPPPSPRGRGAQCLHRHSRQCRSLCG